MNPDTITPQRPQLPAHHASPTLKLLLLLFGIAVVAVLGYFVWMVNGEADTTDYSTKKVTKTEQSTKTDTTAVVTPVACGDKAYAFSLTFGAKWNGYKVKKVDPTYALVTCYFEMPTTSTDEVWTVATTDHSAGYASLFAVSVYTPAQWITAQDEANKPTKLGETAKYVWGWSPAQAYPDDLQASKIADDVKNVVATFAIAP